MSRSFTDLGYTMDRQNRKHTYHGQDMDMDRLLTDNRLSDRP